MKIFACADSDIPDGRNIAAIRLGHDFNPSPKSLASARPNTVIHGFSISFCWQRAHLLEI